MNYVKHLNAVFLQFYRDDRLHYGHISLYMALFFYWNLHHFSEGFYANRTELMHMAKIGSKSTYHRLIKNLSDWKYIEYLPSRNPHKKTMVRVCHFCTGKGTEMGGTGTLMERYHPKTVPLTLYKKQLQTNRNALANSPKNESEVLEYFKSKKWPVNEASKFYNHYQAIGWKLGGKTPIVDWTATAENWMLKAQELLEEKARKSNFENSFFESADRKSVV